MAFSSSIQSPDEHNVLVNFKTAHPPAGQTLGSFDFFDKFWSNSSLDGQMLHLLELQRGPTPMIRAETSNERPRLFNRETKCKTNTLAKRTGNQGNNRDMRTMV